MKPRDPRRALILKLRRRVRVTRRFDIAPDPKDPLGEIQVCLACKHVERVRHDTTLKTLAGLIGIPRAIEVLKTDRERVQRLIGQ